MTDYSFNVIIDTSNVQLGQLLEQIYQVRAYFVFFIMIYLEICIVL